MNGKPRYSMTREEALQLRALGRFHKAEAKREPNKRDRVEQMLVANAEIRAAEKVLGK